MYRGANPIIMEISPVSFPFFYVYTITATVGDNKAVAVWLALRIRFCLRLCS